MQNVPGHLYPVIKKYSLYLRDHRAPDLKVGVAPMFRILRAPGPFRRDADAAGKRDTSVGDQNLSVGSIVEPAEVRPMWRVKFSNLNACCRHFFDEIFALFGV